MDVGRPHLALLETADPVSRVVHFVFADWTQGQPNADLIWAHSPWTCP